MFGRDNKVYLKGDKKMSKKYYVVIASLLNRLFKQSNNAGQIEGITFVMQGLIEIMRSDNPNFQESKFLEAVFK